MTITRMCKDTGIGRAAMTEYQKGRTKALSTATLYRIAEYFQVSMEFMINGDASPKSYMGNAEWDVAKCMEDLLQEVPNERTLLFYGIPLCEEARKSVSSALKLGMQAAKHRNMQG